MDPKIEDLNRKISFHLDQIQKLFKNAEVSIYIHQPDLPDGDLVATTEKSVKEAGARMNEFIAKKGLK